MEMIFKKAPTFLLLLAGIIWKWYMAEISRAESEEDAYIRQWTGL
jgi:hypothetical protein